MSGVWRACSRAGGSQLEQGSSGGQSSVGSNRSDGGQARSSSGRSRLESTPLARIAPLFLEPSKDHVHKLGFKRSAAPPCTDNFQLAPFEFNGAVWQSVEQCYQAQKYFPTDPETHTALLNMMPFAGETAHSHGMRVWLAGARGRLRPDWDVVKVELMVRACRAKLAAHAQLRAELLATADLTIVGAPSTSWQSKSGGGEWSKWNGRIQMLLREELKAADESTSSAPARTELHRALQEEVDAYMRGPRAERSAGTASGCTTGAHCITSGCAHVARRDSETRCSTWRFGRESLKPERCPAV